MSSQIKTLKVKHPAFPTRFERFTRKVAKKLAAPIRRKLENFFGGPQRFTACDWDDYMDLCREWEKKHPIRAWFYWNWNWPLIKLKDLKYYVRARWIKRFHTLDLRNKHYKYGYIDPVQQILYANFAILAKFVESGEMAITEWDPEIEKEIMDLYTWWTETYNEERWQLVGGDEIAPENEMLIRLIKIRGYLWT